MSMKTQSLRLCMVAALCTTAMIGSAAAQAIHVGGNGGSAGNTGGFGASMGGGNGISGNTGTQGDAGSSGNFNLSRNNGGSNVNLGSLGNTGSISGSTDNLGLGGIGIGTSGPSSLTQAYNELSASEQKKLRLKCSSVAADPANFDPALVSLCEALGM